MNFLLLTQYYPPESGSASLKMAELAEYLVYKGHNVTVITGFPNYPYGKVYNGYKMKLYKKEKIKGVNIIRTPLYIASKRRSFKHRMMNHVSFMLTSIYGCFLTRKPDLIYYYSPPLFLGFSAWVLGKIYRVPVVSEINDLWPQAPIALGLIKNPLIIKAAEGFEKFVYRRNAFLFFYSNTMRSMVTNKGVPERKAEIHPLWISTIEFCPKSQKEVEEIKIKYNFNGKFTIMYAGYIGLAQGLDVVLNVAEILSQCKDILFVLIGEGPEKENLIIKAEISGLKNIMFIPFQSKEVIARFLSAADVLFAHLDPAPHRLGTIPSKILAYMSIGKPLIIAAEGETKNLIEKSKCGIVVEPRNGEAIAKATLSLYKNVNLRKKMGEKGRAYVIENFDENRLLPKLESRLIDIALNKT